MEYERYPISLHNKKQAGFYPGPFLNLDPAILLFLRGGVCTIKMRIRHSYNTRIMGAASAGSSFD